MQHTDAMKKAASRITDMVKEKNSKITALQAEMDELNKKTQESAAVLDAAIEQGDEKAYTKEVARASYIQKRQKLLQGKLDHLTGFHPYTDEETEPLRAAILEDAAAVNAAEKEKLDGLRLLMAEAIKEANTLLDDDNKALGLLDEELNTNTVVNVYGEEISNGFQRCINTGKEM